MKTDKELLRIWDNQDNSNKDFWIYQRLDPDEKTKLFDLLEYRKPIFNKKLKLKGVKRMDKQENIKDI